jgi:hypothetical protein
MPALVTALAIVAQASTIRIANFNIQVFGSRKAADSSVMTVLARIARQFDVMAVEEFRDETGRAPQQYLERINRERGPPVRHDRRSQAGPDGEQGAVRHLLPAGGGELR